MTRTEELTAGELARLSSVVTRRSGMAFGEGRWPFLRTRAREVMARTGFTSGRVWVEELEASASVGGPLYEELEQALHVHETRFFRYPHHHRVLRETVVPEALAGDGGARLRVLSIGCSTGEEPYSLAITLAETCRALRLGRDEAGITPDVEMLAIDLSRAALDTAVAAHYGAPALADVPAPYLARWFTPARGGFLVAPEIRALVRFFQHDIRRDVYLGKFDVVVCCNVLLYFTAAVKRRILTRVAGTLRRGGWLLLGHADGVAPGVDGFRTRHLPAGVVLQRT